MELLTADIIKKFYMLIWPLTRISAAIMIAPFMGSEASNIRVRLILTLVLGLMVYSLMPWPTLNPLSSEGMLALLNEIAIGLVMGLTLQIVLSALLIAGQAISASMGLSMASLMDPGLGNVPLLSQFLLLLGGMIFFALGGHLLLISCLVESFRLLPVGKLSFSVEAAGRLLTWSSMLFLGAVLICLPLLASLLLINVGVGIMTRAAPSLNIFSVGFPAMVVSGLILFLLCMSNIGNRTHWLWLRAFENIRLILGMA